MVIDSETQAFLENRKNGVVTNDINFEASKKLFNLASRTNVKKFVFASSCSIYGSYSQRKLLLELKSL